MAVLIYTRTVLVSFSCHLDTDLESSGMRDPQLKNHHDDTGPVDMSLRHFTTC